MVTSVSELRQEEEQAANVKTTLEVRDALQIQIPHPRLTELASCIES